MKQYTVEQTEIINNKCGNSWILEITTDYEKALEYQCFYYSRLTKKEKRNNVISVYDSNDCLLIQTVLSK